MKDSGFSGNPLDPAAVSAYARDGAICLRGAIAAPWIERLRAGMERNLREPGPYTRGYTADGKPGRFFGDYCNWQRIPEYYDFFAESGAGALAAALMRSKTARIFHEHVLIKEPGTEERTPWHHDQPYYCVDGKQVISFLDSARSRAQGHLRRIHRRVPCLGPLVPADQVRWRGLSS